MQQRRYLYEMAVCKLYLNSAAMIVRIASLWRVKYITPIYILRNYNVTRNPTNYPFSWQSECAGTRYMGYITWTMGLDYVQNKAVFMITLETKKER